MKKSAETISGLVSDLKTLILLLKTMSASKNYDSDNISIKLSQLNSIALLSDAELQTEFQERLQRYIDNEIITPNLMYSVVFGSRSYLNCSFYKIKVPYEVRKVLARKTRKLFFSIVGNFLGNWDIDYGEIKSDAIKSQWLFSQKFNIQNASFIATPYDSLYHYGNLYDFTTEKFSSIKPMMKNVLEFCSKHLKNPHMKEKDQFTAYLEEKESLSEKLNKNHIKSLEILSQIT